jgi:hypothetical protein
MTSINSISWARIDLTIVARTPCTLTGETLLLSSDRRGVLQALPVTWTAGSSANPTGPVTLEPGQRTGMLVGFHPGCPNGPAYQGIALRQSGATIRVPGLTLQGICDHVSAGPWQQPGTPLAPPEKERYGGLVPLLDVPATVARGTTLAYVVDLTNPTQETVVLDPCPVYQESVANVHLSYLLNCEGVTIPAGGSARFEMRLAVASDASGGPSLVDWAIFDSVYPVAVASAPIVVTGPGPAAAPPTS